MKTLKAILFEHAEEMQEEIDDLFDIDIDEVEVKFTFNFWDEPEIEVNKIRREEISVNLDED